MIANCIVHASSRQQLLAQLAYTFDVPETLRDARLNPLEQRMRNIVAQEQMGATIREATSGYDYSYRHPLIHGIEYLVKDGSIVGRRHRADV